MSTKKIKVKPAKNRIVYSDFINGFLLDPNKYTELTRTHWLEKRIVQGDLILNKSDK